MNYYGTTFWSPTDLTHHGILGQRWGIRRYQNKDGSLTNAGRKRLKGEIKKREDSQVELRRKASLKEIHELYNQQHLHTTALKNELFKNTLEKSEEYKNYNNAREKAEKYDMDLMQKLKNKGLVGNDLERAFLDDKKRDYLLGEVIDAERAYYRKTLDVYSKQQDALYQARLKDLGLDSKYYNVYKEYFMEENKDSKPPLKYLYSI